MNAPTATQPLPENDSRPARPTFFQTPASAETYATRLAMAASHDGLARPVEFAQGVYQGGNRYFAAESAAPSDDYVVRELPAAEVTRRQQAGIRRAIERCGHQVKAHELSAGIARPGSCFERIHLERVAELQEQIRELEERLTVALAPIVPACCPYGATKAKTKADPCWACCAEALNAVLPRDCRGD